MSYLNQESEGIQYKPPSRLKCLWCGFGGGGGLLGALQYECTLPYSRALYRPAQYSTPTLTVSGWFRLNQESEGIYTAFMTEMSLVRLGGGGGGVAGGGAKG